VPLLEAVRLALIQIRVQKLKSFFTLVGVMIGVMFLIAVVSIVAGMSRYMEDDLVGKLIAVTSSPSSNINARSITFLSSRTLPRQLPPTSSS
jgi:ABC-type lipoprotein release transport system permease subunit